MFVYNRVPVRKNQKHKQIIARICSARTVALSVVSALALSTAIPVITMAAPVSGTNNDATVTTNEVANALQDTAGILSQSDDVKTTSDSDSAIKAATAGASIDIPKDASNGVTLASNGGPTLDIELPNADKAKDAQAVAPGVVSYPSTNGSANAVQVTEDGGVRMLTVIDNPNAPTAYDYKVSVPNGGRIELTEVGGAMVIDAQGEVIMLVDAPWAKDANDKVIETWFTTDGQTLTQHVKHNVEGVVYPVTADPWWKRWYGWDFEFTRRQTNNIMLGMAGAAAASLYIPDASITKMVSAALIAGAGYAGWAYNNGGCLKLRLVSIGWNRYAPVLGHYYGGNCR